MRHRNLILRWTANTTPPISPPPPLRQYMLLRSVHRVTVRTEFREGGAEELKCWRSCSDPDSRRGAFFPHLKCSFLFRLPVRGAEEDLTGIHTHSHRFYWNQWRSWWRCAAPWGKFFCSFLPLCQVRAFSHIYSNRLRISGFVCEHFDEWTFLTFSHVENGNTLRAVC